ncbi:hypothetical protein BDQ17DRAFT_1335173 [Cyathus striatus]|nr:hypothetical protein BDQ17DRAFT_1335173 [Cyathus striatus]
MRREMHFGLDLHMTLYVSNGKDESNESVTVKYNAVCSETTVPNMALERISPFLRLSLTPVWYHDLGGQVALELNVETLRARLMGNANSGGDINRRKCTLVNLVKIPFDADHWPGLHLETIELSGHRFESFGAHTAHAYILCLASQEHQAPTQHKMSNIPCLFAMFRLSWSSLFKITLFKWEKARSTEAYHFQNPHEYKYHPLSDLHSSANFYCVVVAHIAQVCFQITFGERGCRKWRLEVGYFDSEFGSSTMPVEYM